MGTYLEITLGLAQNLAIYVAVVFLHGIFFKKLENLSSLQRSLLTGTIFGIAAVIGMADPVRVMPGVQVDGRDIMILLASPFGGGFSSLVTAVIAGAARMNIGGSGSLAATITGFAVAVVGMAYTYRWSPGPERIKVSHLIGLSIGVVVLNLIGAAFIPGLTLARAAVFMTPMALNLLFGTILLGVLLRYVHMNLTTTQNLAKTEASLSLHIQNTPLGCISWDRDFNCTAWNTAAEKIFGYSADETIGHHASEIVVPAEIRDDINDLYQKLLNQSGGSRSTNENTTKDGGAIICDWYNTPIVGGNGEVTGVISLVQDITERKRIEESLHKAHEELEQRVEERTLELSREVAERKRAEELANIASSTKSNLMANMSHELRTPLNAIIGFSSTMKSETFGPIGEKYMEYANDINVSGEHLLELINDILDVSAIEAGALELHDENVDISTLVDASVRIIKPRAENGKVIVTSSIDLKLPQIYVDERRVKQVLLNLLSNAVKFTPEEGKVSVSSLVNRDASLAIVVSDTGIGMDGDEVKKALSAFGQVDSGLDRKYEGIGLGLPLTKSLMELHGGTLEIKSEKGKGTSVTVTFPKERVI